MSDLQDPGLVILKTQVESLAGSMGKMESGLVALQDEVRNAITDLAKATGDQLANMQANQNQQITDVHRRIEERANASKVPFGTMIALGGFLLAFVGSIGTLAVAPIQAATMNNAREITALERSLAEMKEQAAGNKARLEGLYLMHDRMDAHQDTQIDVLQKELQRMDDRLWAELTTNQGD